MRDRFFLSLVLIAVTGATVFAQAAGPRGDLPSRFVPALDGAPATAELAAEGLRVSAWPYRSGAEYDLAVSVEDASGRWSRPQFFGAGDGVDQIDPAIAVDSNGTAYLFYASRPAASVWLTIRPKGGSWSRPIAVTAAEARGSAPAVGVVGERLVLAYRSGRRTMLLDFPIWTPPPNPFGVQDGPDGVDPLGETSPPPISPD